jgi:hypothetical protein
MQGKRRSDVQEIGHLCLLFRHTLDYLYVHF